MDKQEMLKMIDDHKSKLIDPVEMLRWTYVRLFIYCIPSRDFTKFMELAEDLARR